MPLSLPFPNSPQDGDAFLSQPVRSNINAITQAIQSFDGSQVQAGSIAAAALATAANPVTRGAETLGNFVASGCAWSASTGLTANMTSGVAYVNGVRVSVLAVTGKTFAASSDTYVDVDTLGNLYYLPVGNGAAAPALTGNALRVAKIITSASVVTAVGQNGSDSLFNPIYSKSPINLQNYILGQSVQSYTNAGTAGGTFYYLNLGGIKLLWGFTATQSVTGSGAVSALYGLTFPTGFFSTIQSATATAANFVNTQYLYTGINTISTTNAGLYLTQTSGANGGATIQFLAIGT